MEALEKHVRKGKLKDLVADNAFYKRSSSSKSLFDLMLRQRKIKLEGEIIFHIIYVSEKR